jgi:hypothetical protein
MLFVSLAEAPHQRAFCERMLLALSNGNTGELSVTSSKRIIRFLRQGGSS